MGKNKWEKQQFMENRGGANSLSFEKLWEGDLHLTKETDDITNGALDVSQCRVLMVCYSGLVENKSLSTLTLGMGRARVNSDSDGDFKLSKSESRQVNITSIMVRQRENSWFLLRSIGTYNITSTDTPLKFDANGGFAADLRFAIYGIKL